MPKYQTTRIIPYAQDKFFNVMMDIEKYPDILNFIKAIDIKDKKDNFISAHITIGLGILSFSYDCEITFFPYETIEITATKGAFKHLYAKWSFKALSPEKTEVTCFLDSEFTSRSMEKIGGKIFAHQFQKAIKTFQSYLKRSDRKRP